MILVEDVFGHPRSDWIATERLADGSPRPEDADVRSDRLDAAQDTPGQPQA